MTPTTKIAASGFRGIFHRRKVFRLCVNSLFAATLAAQTPSHVPTPMTERRVSELVGKMTLEEKVSQMQNHAVAIPRLDVPEYDWWSEGLHGIARSGYATVFPQAIGLAAMWVEK